MSQGIVLTQYSTPAPVPLAARGCAAPAELALPVHYRSLEAPAQAAMLEHCSDIAPLEVAGAGASAVAAQVARYVCSQVSDSGPATQVHRVLMMVAFNVPQERYLEVEQWYDEEHGPLLLKAPGWLRMRRYHVRSSVGGSVWTSIALHELRDTAVLDSAERIFARATAWRARLERESWFQQAGRWVYERL